MKTQAAWPHFYKPIPRPVTSVIRVWQIILTTRSLPVRCTDLAAC